MSVVEDPRQMLGQTIDRYRLEALIGQGGYGAVYRARHVHLGNDVALKLLVRDGQNAQAVERFLRESSATSSIVSPHVVKVLDCGIEPRPFLVMELLEGESLESWRDREGGSLADALLLMDQVLSGIAAAHSVGIVHRDLKPENVFLCGPHRHVVILDFGIAKAGGGPALTRTGTMMGTPRYAAPEQLRSAKHVDARADVYSIGLMLYRILSGEYPFDTSGYERMLVAICRRARTPLSEVAPHLPDALCRAIDRSVAYDPDGRFSSALDLQQALRTALRGDSGRRLSQQVIPTLPMVQMPDTSEI